MHGARWSRHPLVLLVTAAIVAIYLYGYGSKITQTQPVSPAQALVGR